MEVDLLISLRHNTMEMDIDNLQKTLDISLNTSKTLIGGDDPNFKRIHHHNHHIVLYVKDYIMKDKCKNYFEIGTHFGHSLSNIVQSEYPSKIVSCDLFLRGTSIATDCKILDIEKLANSNLNKFNTKGYDCRILKGNSHSKDTAAKVKKEFPNGIDLLFIDGDHRRNAVIADFELYFPMVNSGGYIVFDDYLPYVWAGKKRECPIAINDLVEKHKNQIEVIGLVDDLVGCNKIKNLDNTKNCDFIVIKK